jgi:hypothetical protein
MVLRSFAAALQRLIAAFHSELHSETMMLLTWAMTRGVQS